MITTENFKNVLKYLEFKKDKDVYYKEFKDIDAILKVDFKNKKLIYPTNKGFIISGDFTTSFTQKENFVVFECVHRLFEKGYKPNHIELEPKWTVGHGASGGRADIMVKDNSGKSLLIIECKTAGKEYEDEWKKTLINGGQVLSYAKQAGSTQFVALYASDFIDDMVIPKYYLLILKDNEKLLEELVDKEPLSYEKAKLLDREDIFKAWKETYSQDFATKGLFEDDIPAYDIGKTKYSLQDLDKINSNDIQGKYHQFATIMRQHNVSGRENAFDKLVNLFLCKIVDETNNPDELKFYWKGIAYDSFFELQDRLQKLYQEGMKRFLGEDVTYIDNEAIDQAFRFFKKDPDATKETIKKYFRELKFFTNNDFAFIDVHNEKLFYQNAAVLLKIVQMLQDIRLKDTEEEHQFLGDMFEGFLDQGVKQSEGQFFTPMPIVKFILKSLPLENIINENENIPKVIDYACGAGHFLNEYAQEIKSIVKVNKEIEIEKYYENIVGIEKEYRLSKVAKVSSFMYGQDDINIVYGDALANLPKIKNNEYSVLVANPPYSVKGYLETLSVAERKNYQLIETVGEKSYPNNNSIEAFFIERAKQLLKPGGIAAIIVPSTILTKGKAKSTSSSTNIYVATREILLKYFDIVAIAEFGSGTFGKTGTNTVTLFIRRKEEDPAPALHYKNRIDDWFKGDKTKQGVFEDEHLIKKYCAHIEIKFNDYETLLKGNPSEALLECEIFLAYKKEFDKWAEIKNRKKQKTFKNLKKEKQEKELKEKFISYIVTTEKDKLYYFVLASLNPREVLIVKSPSKKSEIKEFLGYDWSSAKGNEGIKYLGNATIDTIEGEDEDEGIEVLEKEDKRVLSNLLNLNNINTPLYDPKDKYNEGKINNLILYNFKGLEFKIPESLESFVSKSSLINMLDFERIDFPKTISLTPRKKISFETKWELTPLYSLISIINGLWKGEKPPFSKVNVIRNTNFTMDGKLDLTDVAVLDVEKKQYSSRKLEFGDIIIEKSGGSSTQAVGRVVFFDIKKGEYSFSNFTTRLRCNSKEIISEYLYFLLNYIYQTGDTFHLQSGLANLKNLDLNLYLATKIPVPPMSIQNKIISESNAIDNEFKKSKLIISDSNKEIENLFNNADSKANSTYRLSDNGIFDIGIGKRVLKNEINNEGKGIPVYSANVFKQFGYIDKELLKDFSKPSILWGIDGDWMVKTLPANKPFYPTDHCGVMRVKTDVLHPRYLAWLLLKEGQRVRFSRSNRASIDSMKGLTVKAPSKVVQMKAVLEVQKLERDIRGAEKVISSISKRKEEVIKKYL